MSIFTGHESEVIDGRGGKRTAGSNTESEFDGGFGLSGDLEDRLGVGGAGLGQGVQDIVLAGGDRLVGLLVLNAESSLVCGRMIRKAKKYQ